MAKYLCIFSAVDAHIQFIAAHEGSAKAYYEGEAPAQSPTQRKQRSLLGSLLTDPDEISRMEVPESWPQDQPDVVDIAANASNAAMYHFLLNGSSQVVSGPVALFQSLYGKSSGVISVGDSNDEFAVEPEMLSALLERLNTVTSGALPELFEQWLDEHGIDEDDCEADLECLQDEFEALRTCVADAVAAEEGLVWIIH